MHIERPHQKAATPTNKMSPAVDKVLGTYELLETILAGTDIVSLFTLQRVRSTWRDVINRSDTLQKMMYLRPNGAALHLKRTATWVPFHVVESRVQTSPAYLLYQQGGSSTARDEGSPWSSCLPPLGHIKVIPILNDTNCFEFATTIAPSRVLEECEDWRRMVLTQPPIKACLLSEKSKHMGESCTIYNPTGITLGDIFHCRKKMEEAEQYYEDVAERHEWYASFILQAQRTPSLGTEPDT